VHHLSGGAWGLGVRRIMEAAARCVPLVAVLFVPVVLGMPHLFKWTDANLVAHSPILQAKEPYLNVQFFIVRAVIYFIVWGALTFILTGWSRAQDTTPTPPPADRKFRSLSGPGLVLYGVTISFAACCSWSARGSPGSPSPRSSRSSSAAGSRWTGC
jgi:hypothetical protein